MREYKIKRGYNPDIDALIEKFFGVQGNILNGVHFSVDGIGDVDIRREKSLLIVDIVPPKTVCSDYSVIRRWNDFLFEATGKTTKERKKDFSKM